MAQSKSRKLVTGTISAAVIASALAPVAASASTVKITTVYNPSTKTVYQGQSVSLPSTVTVKYSNGKKASTKVSWGKVSTSVGTHKITGHVAGTTKTVSITVVVKADSVKSVSTVSSVTVKAGLVPTSPKATVMYYSGKKTTSMVDLSKVDTSRVGTQTIKRMVAGQTVYVDVKVTAPGVTSATPLNAKQIKVVFDNGKTVTVNLPYSFKDGSVKSSFSYYGNYYKSITLSTPYVAPVTAPAVDSVSAINGAQILVKFNQPVDTTTAQNASNYEIGGSNSVASAVVQPDGKSVLLTLANAVPTGSSASYALTISGVLLGTDTTQEFGLYTGLVTVSDAVAPTVTGVTSSTNGGTASSVTVNFSEPVKAGYAVKIDGTYYAPSTQTYAYGSKGILSATFIGLSLDSTKIHTVEVVGLTDLSGNTTDDQTSNLSITRDAVAPTITSVVPSGDHAFLVTFSKAMPVDENGNLVSGSDSTNLMYPNFFVKDENLAEINGSNPVASSATSVVATDSTNTKFVVSFNAASPLYATTNTRNLTLLVKGTVGSNVITDTVGNALADTTKTVTFTKDTAAPTVTGVTAQKNSAGAVTQLTVKYNKAVTGTPNLTGISFVDSSGVAQSASDVSSSFGTPVVSTTDNTQVIIPINASSAVSSYTGNYSISMPSGVVTDTALTANPSAAYTGIVNFGAASPTSNVFTGTTATSTVDHSNNNNVITVTFPTAVKGGVGTGSATDLSSYRLNGMPLPAGTTITLNAASGETAAQTIATITLPVGTIPTDDTKAVLTANNIVALNGQNSGQYVTTVNVDDNTAPVLQGAQLLSYDNSSNTASFELTFNENMNSAIGTLKAGELSFYDNGNEKTFTTATGTNTVSSPNKVIVNVTGITLNTADTLTITTADNATATPTGVKLTDASTLHNGLADGVTVTVK